MERLIPFEIHITTNELTAKRQNEFIDFCLRNDAKPLMIELSRGKFKNQPMFSKVIFSNNIDNILSISTELSKSLHSQNFKSKRLKIEIPADDFILFKNYKSSFKKYFEWHGKIEFIQIEKLNELCDKNKVHLSKNSLKDEISKRFITLREFGTKVIFENRIHELIKELKEGNWNVYKQQAEYCIYDNNNFLDSEWLLQ